MPINENSEIFFPEEADLNTKSISEGLSEDEKRNLRKDLESVEQGRSFLEPLPLPGDRWADRDFAAEDRREFEEEPDNYIDDIRALGVTEAEATDEQIRDYYLRARPTGNEDPNVEARLKEADKTRAKQMVARGHLRQEDYYRLYGKDNE